MLKSVRVVRPSGAASIAEWGADQHRLIDRSQDELREIAREVLVVRTQLHETETGNSMGKEAA